MSNKRKEKGQGKSSNKTLIVIIVGLVISILLFMSLISLESSMMEKYDKADAVITLQNITEKTLITKDNVNKLFGTSAVDKYLVTDNVVTDVNELVGKMAIIDMGSNQIVADNFVRDGDSVASDISDPAEVSFAVGSMTQAVNGQIRSHDIVNIHVQNAEGTGYVKTDVYIKEALTGDGVAIANDDTESIATAFIVLLDKKEVNDFIAAINTGTVYVTYPQNDNKKNNDEIKADNTENNDINTIDETDITNTIDATDTVDANGAMDNVETDTTETDDISGLIEN